jgi:hypothetical protein
MFNRLNNDRFMDRARHVMTESRDFARASAEQTSDFIHSKPVVATMLGVGAGLILSIFYRRRKQAARKGGNGHFSRPSSSRVSAWKKKAART